KPQDRQGARGTITAGACEGPFRPVSGRHPASIPLAKPPGTPHIAAMAILKIARMGHPVLRRKAAPVADPTAPEIRRLVNDMLETLADIGGLGLAAPQVHVPLRAVIFEVPAGRAAREGDGAGAVPMTVL